MKKFFNILGKKNSFKTVMYPRKKQYVQSFSSLLKNRELNAVILHILT